MPGTAESANSKMVTIGVPVLALIVSVLAFFVSLLVYLETRTHNQRVVALETGQIIQHFEQSGIEYPFATSCFEFVKDLSDTELRMIFRNIPEGIPVRSGKLQLNRCLGKPTTTPLDRLEADEDLDRFRRTIFGKLNAYEHIFRAIRDEAGNRDDLCNAAWSSFDQYANDALMRINKMRPIPDEFQEIGQNYNSLLQFLDGGVCFS